MAIVFVQRDGLGNITGVYACKQPGVAEEQLSDTDPAVVAFRNPPPLDSFDIILPILRKWAFDIDNRVRVLEGQPVRTAAQFKAYVKSL